MEEKKDSKGETVNYIEYGEIEYPRHDKESYAQYLTRLFIKEEEKQRKQMERMLRGFTSFSSTLENSIKKTLLYGDSIRKAMESIRPIQPASISPIVSKLPEINFSEINKARLMPFNELAERLDKLIDVSAQSAEFMVETNEIQTRIAGEIKSSGDQTTRLSKKNISLTIIVIFLTVINLAVFIFSIFKSISVSDMQRLDIQKNANMLADKLSDINNNITVVNDKAIELIESKYVFMNKSLRIENDTLKKQIVEQGKKIDEMKSMILRQDKKLEELEKK